ncbi:MAG: AAA family ATPase [Pirellulales bacterium]|nr:AAA family ATPase [Pirellulales bacterium]
MSGPTEKIENAWPDSAVAARPLFRSASHEEALARAHFLVEHRKLLGLVAGQSGTGRSSLFVALADELRRKATRVACLHLYGVSADEMLWQLAAELKLNPKVDIGIGQLWRQITDALAAARFEQRHVVVLFDDVDRAQADVVPAIMRIAKCDPAAIGQQTLVLGCHVDRVATLGASLLELATLRIELRSWSVDEVGEYLTHVPVESAAGVAAQLHELSDGNPRRVSQLLDLGLVAAQAQGHGVLDCALINAVEGQLAVSHT